MTQGESARDRCPSDILVALLEGDMGFENIVETLSHHHSRGTVSKYLNELYGDRVQRRGRKGPYYLTSKGRKDAENARTKKVINGLSDSTLEKFMLAYKKLVTRQLHEIWSDMAIDQKVDEYVHRPDY